MHVGVVVTEGMFDSGLSAVHDILDTANGLREQIDRPPQPWTVTRIGASRQVRTGAGALVEASLRSEVSVPLDLMLLPALGAKDPVGIVEAVASPELRPVAELIAAARADGAELASACTGTFLLAEAGVLDARSATTSWWLGPALRKRYPKVHVEESRTLVYDDGVTTAGAAFAHIDLALALIQRRSPALADLTARYLLIGDRPSQATFAVPSLLAQANPVMSQFERWVRDHLDEPIQISAAAHALGLSERTLQRTTAATVGMSPVDFVNEVRLDHATFLVKTTSLTADAIASRVGYQNAGTLRALVRRRRGVTLRQLRG